MIFSESDLSKISAAARAAAGDVRWADYDPASDPEMQTFRDFYSGFLTRNTHGSLQYLEGDLRFDVRHVFPETRSLFAFAFSYRRADVDQYLREAEYKIARYAWGQDYHDFLREYLELLFQGFTAKFRVAIDSAPVPERYLAARMGLGAIGRNGMLIGSEGSFTILAFVFTNARTGTGMPAAASLVSQINGICGDCKRCVDACPTTALRGDGTMNISRCLSYQTIERPLELHLPPDKKHRWVFGCDVCQTVCPHNQASGGHRLRNTHPGFTPGSEVREFSQTAKLTPGLKSTALARALRKGGLLKNVARINPADDGPSPSEDDQG